MRTGQRHVVVAVILSDSMVRRSIAIVALLAVSCRHETTERTVTFNPIKPDARTISCTLRMALELAGPREDHVARGHVSVDHASNRDIDQKRLRLEIGQAKSESGDSMVDQVKLEELVSTSLGLQRYEWTFVSGDDLHVPHGEQPAALVAVNAAIVFLLDYSWGVARVLEPGSLLTKDNIGVYECVGI